MVTNTFTNNCFTHRLDSHEHGYACNVISPAKCKFCIHACNKAGKSELTAVNMGN